MSSPAAKADAPNHASTKTGARRAFTLPALVARRRPSPPRPKSNASADGIETLCTCPATKIVSFTAWNVRPWGAEAQSAQPGGLPWTSPSERTLAVGVLRMYRVTSSNVSFLNSGNLLHTIFPKSQCWCIDGQHKFALRIRQDSYYRIELPYETDEDKRQAEDFKAALDQVLQYEKTPCPFARAFKVELPERPKTPPRRMSRKPPEKAKKWLFDKAWVPEDGSRPTTPVLPGSAPASGTIFSEEDDHSSDNTDKGEGATGPELRAPLPRASPQPSIRDRTRAIQALRSVTSPTGLAGGHVPSLQQSTETLSRKEETDYEDPTETISLMSSADSFDTATQGSPSPEFLDAEAELLNQWEHEQALHSEQKQERGRHRHRRQLSDITVRQSSSDPVVVAAPHTPVVANPGLPTLDLHPSPAPSTPLLINDSDDDVLEPLFLNVPTPPDTIPMRRRTGATQQRSFSPMPLQQNLFCPPNSARRTSFTAAIVRKTCELILGPPAHLVTLMLKIAARISNGAFGFNTYRVRETPETRIPCSWESSDEDWEEDDFGIPLGNLDIHVFRQRNVSGELD